MRTGPPTKVGIPLEPQEALDELLAILEKLGAIALAIDIRRAVSEGAIGKIEVGPKKRHEVARQPLPPADAYRLAATMLCAAIDPVLMVEDLSSDLSNGPPLRADVRWSHDTLEGSPLEPAPTEVIAIPGLESDHAGGIRSAAERLVMVIDDRIGEE